MTAPAAAQASPGGTPQAGHPSFFATKIQVADMAANLRFYRDLLGMRVVPNDAPGHEEVVMLAMSDRPPAPGEGPLLILNSEKKARTVGTAYGALVMIVANVDETLAKMVTAGITVLGQPKHSGSVAVAYVADPDGRPVELLQIGGR